MHIFTAQADFVRHITHFATAIKCLSFYIAT